MKKYLALLFLASSAFVPLSAQVTNPSYFPAFDPFTSATASGGTSYAAGTLLAGQTNALGSYWYGIDSTGNGTNAPLKLTGGTLSYASLPAFSGNEILLTNVAGEGARMFVWPTATVSTGGSGGFFQTGPQSVFYSFVMQVSNINNLTTNTNGYICGFGDQSVVATQTSQPGTVSTRLYLQKVSGGYQVGLAKMASVSYAPTVYTTNQVLLIVADYEIQTSDASGSAKTDLVRLWINPATNTFGAPVQPAEILVTGTSDVNLTPYTSCFQFYDIANAPNDTYITDFRMGTNWSWVTGGPAIGVQPSPNTNVGTGVLNLSVTALNNGTPNSYQWQFNGNNLSDGPSISGSGARVANSATASLIISNVTPQDAGSYTVVVSNAYGAVTSAVSTVTTFTVPIITSQSGGTNVLLYAGGSNTITLTVVGAPPLAYYWYSNNVLINNPTNSFTTANLQSSATIYCIVSNSLNTATSAVVSLGVVPIPTFPYPLAVYNDHPAGFWPLNETPDDGNGDQGATAHDYIAGNNGVYSNAQLGIAGYGAGLTNQYGYSPATDNNTGAFFSQFAYPNSYVGQIPNINFGGSAGTSFSVEAWVNAYGHTEPSGAAIVNKGVSGSEQFTLDYTTGWRFFIRNVAGTTSLALSTNTVDSLWHHLVGVVSTANSNVTIYVDGVARASAAYTPSSGILNSALPMNIGSRMGSLTSGFNDNFLGEIEDVAVYSYALTPAQVANHYYGAGVGPTVGALPSSVTVNEGTTLAVPAAAAGTPVLTYQWYNYGTGGMLVGQTNSTLVVSNVTAAAYNFQSFDVVVANNFGSVTSSPVQINVQSGVPYAVAISPAQASIYAGLPVNFTVTSQGSSPFTYQWSTNGQNITGATTSMLTLSAASGSYSVGCAVANSYGPSSPPVTTATLAVVAAPADYYGSVVVSAGPAAFWRLDEPSNSTTAFDYVGAHNATYQNALNGQPGFSPIVDPLETATVFGTNGIVSSYAEENDNTGNGIAPLDFSQGPNAEFSVEAWVQAPPQTADILCKGYPNNTQFALDTGGTGGSFRFVVHNAADTIFTANSASVVPDGNWHYLVGVCDEAGGSILIYADGVRQNTTALTSGSGLLSINNATYPVVIAGQESQGGSGFTVMNNTGISQVAIYPYALTATQVSAHFAAAAGMPSLSPYSITSWSRASGLNITLNWTSVSNYIYQVQAASVLGGPTNSWVNLGSPITPTSTNTSYTTTNASGVATYYRVVGY